MLTESQIAHFRTFGFVVLPNLFSENETETMVAEFELGREASMRYGNSIASKKLTQWSNTHSEFPFIAGMLEDQRFCSAAEQLLEKGFVGAFANSNSRGGAIRHGTQTTVTQAYVLSNSPLICSRFVQTLELCGSFPDHISSRSTMMWIVFLRRISPTD